MLIGYDKVGEIKFYFTDDDYLKSQFPNNTAKVSNFWKVGYEDLKEIFIDNFQIEDDVRSYKILNNELVKKEILEIEKEKSIVETNINKIEPKIIKIENKSLENNEKDVNITNRCLNSITKKEVKYE